jgi:ABC-2 type transport system permease protein
MQPLWKIAAMVRVMALNLWRDRGALLMTFLLPPLVFLIFSSVFAGTTGDDIQLKLAVADTAHTPDSGRLAAALVPRPRSAPRRRRRPTRCAGGSRPGRPTPAW